MVITVILLTSFFQETSRHRIISLRIDQYSNDILLWLAYRNLFFSAEQTKQFELLFRKSCLGYQLMLFRKTFCVGICSAKFYKTYWTFHVTNFLKRIQLNWTLLNIPCRHYYNAHRDTRTILCTSNLMFPLRVQCIEHVLDGSCCIWVIAQKWVQDERRQLHTFYTEQYCC